MKCPNCKSEKISAYEKDPFLMECPDCHSLYTICWCLAYWVGHIDGEKETIHRLNKEYCTIIKHFA